MGKLGRVLVAIQRHRNVLSTARQSKSFYLPEEDRERECRAGAVTAPCGGALLRQRRGQVALPPHSQAWLCCSSPGRNAESLLAFLLAVPPVNSGKGPLWGFHEPTPCYGKPGCGFGMSQLLQGSAYAADLALPVHYLVPVESTASN